MIYHIAILLINSTFSKRPDNPPPPPPKREGGWVGCSTQVSDGPGGNSPKGPLPREGLWGSHDHRNQHGPGKPILMMERFCSQWWSQPYEERQGGAPLQIHSLGVEGEVRSLLPSLGIASFSPPHSRGSTG